MRRIGLQRYQAENVNLFNRTAVRLRVLAVGAEGMEPEIFVFRRITETGGGYIDYYQSVASPALMQTLPIGDPDPLHPTHPEHFRMSVIDGYQRSHLETNKIWEALVREINVLVVAMDQYDALQLEETYACEVGEEPGSSSLLP